MVTDKKTAPRVKANGHTGGVPADPAIKAALDRTYKRSKADIDDLAHM
jgi:hypothetical protein